MKRRASTITQRRDLCGERPRASALLCWPRGTSRLPHLNAIALAAALFGTALSSGCCSTTFLALRTVICEPAHYCFKVDRVRSRRLYREWAQTEWTKIAGSCGETTYGEDYQAGFV